MRRGESQRKDGRYVYKYIDRWGKTKYVYSWRLTDNDKVPPGKANCKPLRTLEAEIQRDLLLKVNLTNSDATLGDYLDAYLANKKSIANTTMRKNKSYVRRIKRSSLGQCKLSDIVKSQAKQFVSNMSDEGLSYSYIYQIKEFVSSAMNDAVEDGILLKNPFHFKLPNVVKNTTEKKGALIEREREELFNFIREKYAKILLPFCIMAYAGLRVSEVCGLTYKDIDFKKGLIHVERQLLYEDSKRMIHPPKTKAGYRYVPMNDELTKLLKEAVREAKSRKNQPVVDGVSGFLFLTRTEKPFYYSLLEDRLDTITRNFEKKVASLRLRVTPHILRHTFGYISLKSGMDIKTLQYIMGHETASITLDVYTNINIDESILDELWVS